MLFNCEFLIIVSWNQTFEAYAYQTHVEVYSLQILKKSLKKYSTFSFACGIQMWGQTTRDNIMVDLVLVPYGRKRQGILAYRDFTVIGTCISI